MRLRRLREPHRRRYRAQGPRVVSIQGPQQHHALYIGAASDPRLAEHVEEFTRTSRETTERLVDIVMGSGSVSPADRERAIDVIWAISSSTVHRRLVESCSWSAQQYGDWLAEEIERALRDAVLAALDTQGALQIESETPFGQMSVDRFIGLYYADPLAHTFDLAHAAGIEAALDPELCQLGYDQLEAAGDAIRFPGMMDAAVEIDADGGIAARFVAMAGRRP